MRSSWGIPGCEETPGRQQARQQTPCSPLVGRRPHMMAIRIHTRLWRRLGWRREPGLLWASFPPWRLGSSTLLSNPFRLQSVSGEGCGHRSRVGMSVFHHATNTEAPWENGPTEWCNATIEEQYELTRGSFEPQTEAENDELTVHCRIAHNRY